MPSWQARNYYSLSKKTNGTFSDPKPLREHPLYVPHPHPTTQSTILACKNIFSTETNLTNSERVCIHVSEAAEPWVAKKLQDLRHAKVDRNGAGKLNYGTRRLLGTFSFYSPLSVGDPFDDYHNKKTDRVSGEPRSTQFSMHV